MMTVRLPARAESPGVGDHTERVNREQRPDVERDRVDRYRVDALTA